MELQSTNNRLPLDFPDYTLTTRSLLKDILLESNVAAGSRDAICINKHIDGNFYDEKGNESCNAVRAYCVGH